MIFKCILVILLITSYAKASGFEGFHVDHQEGHDEGDEHHDLSGHGGDGFGDGDHNGFEHHGSEGDFKGDEFKGDDHHWGPAKYHHGGVHEIENHGTPHHVHTIHHHHIKKYTVVKKIEVPVIKEVKVPYKVYVIKKVPYKYYVKPLVVKVPIEYYNTKEEEHKHEDHHEEESHEHDTHEEKHGVGDHHHHK